MERRTGWNDNVLEQVAAYCSWIERLATEASREGGEAFLLTLIFRQIPGSKDQVLHEMLSEAQRAYYTLLKRHMRPEQAGSEDRYPIWLVVPDRPVFKHEKKLLREVAVNDGRHLHAPAVYWSRQRNGERLDHFLAANQHRLIFPDRPLERVHAKIITKDPARVTDYAFKSVKCGRESLGGVLILHGPDHSGPGRQFSLKVKTAASA